jgi:alcohol dehydrogenase (cytochrome c)
MAQMANGAANWPSYNRGPEGHRFSPLKEITTSNVKDLQVAWIHQPGDIGQGYQETPLAIDGVIYSIASHDRVFALDGATGKEIWHYYPNLKPIADQILFTPLTRGVSIAQGRVYFGTLDGRAIALDQKTGKVVWTTQLVDLRACGGCNFDSPPVVAGNVLTFGTTGGEIPRNGKIIGVDATTGKELWTFNTIKHDPKSWGGDSADSGGGGAWMPGMYDPVTNLVFYGTANPAPDFDWGGARPGDNLYTSSVVALEPETGNLKWYHQEVPHDLWDFDAASGQFMIISHDGKRSLIHYNKGGFVFVYDPADGKIQNIWKLNKYVDWTTGYNAEGVPQNTKTAAEYGKKFYFCPWFVGNWESPSYSPDTGLWYQPVAEACQNVTDIKKLSPAGFPLTEFYFGGTPAPADPPDTKAYGRLVAANPTTGAVKWENKYDVPIYSSVLTTAGGVLFVGDLLGYAHAYDAATGKELWSFNLGSGMHSGPISYEAGGHQYVAFPSGYGGFATGFYAQVWKQTEGLSNGAALIAFRLK